MTLGGGAGRDWEERTTRTIHRRRVFIPRGLSTELFLAYVVSEVCDSSINGLCERKRSESAATFFLFFF